MIYSHTQVGRLMIVLLIAVAVYFGFMLTLVGLDLPIIITLGAILFIVASFATLTVTIDQTHIQVKFGYGIYKKRFLLNEITSVKKVKNHWYYGWGIRVWFFPYMWIYNISGFDAIEIKMKNGRVYRIGTDEPQNLENALIQSSFGR